MNMVAVVKRVAMMLGMFVFLLLLMVGMFSSEKFSFSELPLIFLKATVGFIIFWLFGIIVSDTIVKAISSSLENSKMEKWEGGIASRFIEGDEEDAKSPDNSENE